MDAPFREEVCIAPSLEIAREDGYKYYTYGAHQFAPIYSTETGKVVCLGKELREKEEA